MSTPKFRPLTFGVTRVSVKDGASGVHYVSAEQTLQAFPDRITDRLQHWAQTCPDRTFMARREKLPDGSTGAWKHISYAQAWTQARNIAQSLINRGLSAERPVVILSENDLEHALLALGCLVAGVPFVPTSPAYSLISQDYDKLRHVLKTVTPGMVFAADAARYGKAIAAAVDPSIEVVVTEETVRNYGRYYDAPEGHLRMLVRRKPVGPCLLITPWNFPLAMATRKVGPALAAGCTTIVKPARLTPLTTLRFAELCVAAGVPAGVINVVPTAQAAHVSDPLLADPRLRKVSFTGSTDVGRRLLAQCSTNVLRTSMELGGNAPLLVFDDADLDKAAAGAALAKMRNMGEACTSANRILVHESVVDAFAEKLAGRLRALTVGNGADPGVTCGPLIDGAARDKVADLVDDAVARGARVVVGGKAVPGPGFNVAAAGSRVKSAVGCRWHRLRWLGFCRLAGFGLCGSPLHCDLGRALVANGLG